MRKLAGFLCYKVAACPSLGHSVGGGWHLALRHSCLPPPPFSALQWDHVVLLISQQWLYSPLFSVLLLQRFLMRSRPHLFPHKHMQHTRTFPPILTPAIIFTPLPINSSVCLSLSVSTNRPLTKLFGALAVTGQLSKLHQSVEVAFGSYGHSCRRRGVLIKNEKCLQGKSTLAGQNHLSGPSRNASPWSQSSSDWGWTGPECPVEKKKSVKYIKSTYAKCVYTLRTEFAHKKRQFYLVNIFCHLVDFFSSGHFSFPSGLEYVF